MNTKLMKTAVLYARIKKKKKNGLSLTRMKRLLALSKKNKPRATTETVQ